MEPYSKDILIKIYPKAKENSHFLTVIIMRVNGTRDRHVGKANFAKKTCFTMKVNLNQKSFMELDINNGKMEINLKVFSKKVKNMDQEFTYSQMVADMLANGKMI